MEIAGKKKRAADTCKWRCDTKQRNLRPCLPPKESPTPPRAVPGGPEYARFQGGAVSTSGGFRAQVDSH
eukprot:434264-Pleurochrysis_carterae.AAC.1